MTNDMSRWLGIDHGTRRMGVAVGDTQAGVACPVAQFSAGDPDVVGRISRRAEEYGAVGVVVGWPINADGTEGRQGRLARDFAVELARCVGLDVRIWDERLSSFEADQRLRGHLTRAGKKRRHDAVAAAAFLEDFLRRAGPTRAPRPQAPPAPRAHPPE